MYPGSPLFARKYRQVKWLVKRLQQWHEADPATDKKTQLVLVRKLRVLVRELQARMPMRQLRRVLGPAIVFLGMHTAAFAQPVFLPPVNNPFGLNSLGTITSKIPVFADIDGDGDKDMFLGGYFSGNNITYYQNTGTSTAPQFAAPVTTPFGLTLGGFGSAITFGDIDGDGDLDAMTGDYYGDFRFQLNTGTAAAPAFAPAVLNPFGLNNPGYYNFPTFVNLDGDGDLDLVITNQFSDFVYFQNTGTASTPAFAAAVNNAFGLTNVPSAYTSKAFADFDGDGDLDVMAGGSAYPADFFYLQNTGTATAPAFAPFLTNPFGLSATLYYNQLAAVDLDGDGDFDLVTKEFFGNFEYRQNNAPVGNQPPVIGTLNDSTLCNNAGLAAYPITATDPNQDPVTLFATSGSPAIIPNSGLVISGPAPNFTLAATPTTGASGVVVVTIGATDGTDTTTTTVQLTVLDCNLPPQLGTISDQVACLSDAVGPLALTANDPDGDAFTVTATSSNQAVVPNGSISVTGTAPNLSVNIGTLNGVAGSAVITVIASDGTASDTTTFTVLVNDCNAAPVISPVAGKNGCIGDPVAIGLTVTDPDGDPLILSATSSNQAVVPSGSISFTGTPPNLILRVPTLNGQTGPTTIRVIASDGLLSDTISFVLTVANCNTPPTVSAIPDQTVCRQSSLNAIPFTADDPEGESVTINYTSSNPQVVAATDLIIGGAQPNFTVSTGPLVGQTGTTLITFIVSDGALNDTTSFNITVESCQSIEEPAELAGMELRPNPATEFAELILPSPAPVTALRILDLNGRVLKHMEGEFIGISTRLDLSNLPSGLYMLEVSTAKGKAVRRIVKE